MKFHVGQRVRIDCPKSDLHGYEATIWRIDNGCIHQSWGVAIKSCLRHWLHADGIPPMGFKGYGIAFEASELIPLTKPPETGSWEEIQKILGRDVRQGEVA